MKRRHLILFLGSGRNNLELMAEQFAKESSDNSVSIISASSNPSESDSVAIQVMREAGMEISRLSAVPAADIEPLLFDLIIMLGSAEHQCYSGLPGLPPCFHWHIPDPDPNIPEPERLKQLRHARDELKTKVGKLFESGIMDALFVAQRHLRLILDNLMDGVMAHTAERRIFFFNKEAERITGFHREDVLGKDCHDVFPGKFCGGGCEFCNDISDSKQSVLVKRDVSYLRPDGRERILRMSSMPLSDESDTCIGALISFKDETELKLLKTRVHDDPYSIGGIVGKDPKMLVIFDQIHEVSSVCFPVLIEGESGTGKELVANAIHNLSPRADKPFVAINCGALPEDILESELFGHVRGAFSGAVQSRKGRFELADGGTIFLDEVGEMSLSTQVKLLRVLQEKRFERVGGENSVQVNVRIIAATNQNLRKLIEKKKFRSDLFYRLCVIPIMMPPLRERPSDIPVLADHFLKLTAKELGRPELRLVKEVSDIFMSYAWPGNVRELRNVIEYAYVKCRSHTIRIGDLPPELSGSRKEKPLNTGIPMIPKEMIQQALKNAAGNKKKAAMELGIGRATLYRYLESYGLK